MAAAVADAESSSVSRESTLFYKASEVFRNGWLSAVPNGELPGTGC